MFTSRLHPKLFESLANLALGPSTLQYSIQLYALLLLRLFFRSVHRHHVSCLTLV